MPSWKILLATFIPLFVAFDPIGLLPIYVNLTLDLNNEEKHTILWQSLLTATAVAILFTFVGKIIFNFLGITVSDFQIAGGLILLVLAIMDLLVAQKIGSTHSSTSGIVPIGVPLIVGPAVLTTVIMQIDAHGIIPTIASLIINLVIVGILFIQSHWVLHLIGEGGSKAISKIVSLLLAAIAVMMIRVGIFHLLASR